MKINETPYDSQVAEEKKRHKKQLAILAIKKQFYLLLKEWECWENDCERVSDSLYWGWVMNSKEFTDSEKKEVAKLHEKYKRLS